MKPPPHLALAAVLCLGACGTPGAPRPPSLDLPRPVADLAASRQGDEVTLTWTAPRETTDKQNIRHPGAVRVCRGVNTAAMVECQQVAELPPAPVIDKSSKPQPRGYVDKLPPDLQQQNPTGFATYALQSLNARGRSAGLSNQVAVPLAPTLPAPDQPTGRVTPDAIEVSVEGAEPGPAPDAITFTPHLYRGTEGASGEIDLGGPTRQARLGAKYYATFRDRSFEWEKTYHYRVAVVTSVAQPGKPVIEVEGAPSPEFTLLAHDVFAPAAPGGLQAVASGAGQPPFVDLTWAPGPEPDLAGYNVYRHEAGQPSGKINTELVKAPAYRDREVTSGHQYVYAVTAVDLRGNESPQSGEASERVP
jgi:hypothetical protein